MQFIRGLYDQYNNIKPLVTGNLYRLKNFIFNEYAWILDSGATYNVCFSL